MAPTRAVLGFALAGGLAGAAAADIVVAEYTSDQAFSFEISHMPDLDMLRDFGPGGIDGLPGGGAKFAVPTCAIDIKAYIANHGFPEILPGPADWQLQLNYPTATAFIHLLGEIQGATVNPDGPAPYLAWQIAMGGAESHPLSESFTLTELWGDGVLQPSFVDLSKQALGGALVAVEFGRYRKLGVVQAFPLLERDGGHTFVLTRAANYPSTDLIGGRDPALVFDDDGVSQSLFKSDIYRVSPVIYAASNSLSDLRVADGLEYDPLAPACALIDHAAAIRPKAGFTLVPYQQTIVLKKFHAEPLPEWLLPAEQTYSLPDSVDLHDAQVDFLGTGAYVLADQLQGTGAVEAVASHVDLFDGEVTPLAVLPGARRLAVGRHGHLFALGGAALHCIGPGKEPVVTSVALPDKGAALAYDDAGDEVVVVSTAAKQAWRLDLDLELLQSVPLAALELSGKTAVAVSPQDGALWVASAGAPGAYRATFGAAPAVQFFPAPNGEAPDGIAVDDRGDAFLAAGGALFHYVRKDGSFFLDASSPWSDVAVGTSLEMVRSRRNGDPSTISGPKYRALSPAELAELIEPAPIPDCAVAAADVAYGSGKPGTHGVPELEAAAPAAFGAVADLRIENALPGALPLLLAGTPAALPFEGGTLLVAPLAVIALPVPVAGDGTLSLSAPVPGNAALCGAAIALQMLFVDPGASGPHHVALTNGLLRTVGF